MDSNGQSYGIGVHLDSTLLDGLTPDERAEMVKEYVKELGGKQFTAYDSNGKAVDITIAESSARFKNHNGKRVQVNKDLTTKRIGKGVKQEAIALIDELVVASKPAGSRGAKYAHGWLDNNGQNDWEYWKTYIQDKNGTIWEAILNIANAADGRKILYDISPIKKQGSPSTSGTIPAKIKIAQKGAGVKGQKSLSSNEDIAPLPGEVYGKDVGLRTAAEDDLAPVREDLDRGNVPESGTDALPDDFAPMAEDGEDIEITTTKQKLEAIRENSRQELARNEQLRQESHDRFTQKIEAAQALQMSNPFGNRKFFKKPTVHRIFHLQPPSK